VLCLSFGPKHKQFHFRPEDRFELSPIAHEAPKIGYESRIELMNPMIRGLVGKQMSSSVEGTKIDLIETEEKIKSKVKKAECVEGDVDNGLMSLMRYLFFVLKEDNGESFVVERPEKFGGNLNYNSYEDLEKDFVSKKLHPLDLKNAVAKEIITLLKPFRESKKLNNLHEEAYGKWTLFSYITKLKEAIVWDFLSGSCSVNL